MNSYCVSIISTLSGIFALFSFVFPNLLNERRLVGTKTTVDYLEKHVSKIQSHLKFN